MSSKVLLSPTMIENNRNAAKGGRVRCISCSDTVYPTNYEDPSLLLNVKTRHLRTQSISEQTQDEYHPGTVTYFCRSRGHGFIRPDCIVDSAKSGGNQGSPIRNLQGQNNNTKTSASTEDLFVHISDIDSDYVPRKGDKVSYRMCPFPPKFEKYQAVNVRIVSMSPEPHNRWDSPHVTEDYEDDLNRPTPDV